MKEENLLQFTLDFIPSDDPLQPINFAKVKMELPDDDMELGGNLFEHKSIWMILKYLYINF